MEISITQAETMIASLISSLKEGEEITVSKKNGLITISEPFDVPDYAMAQWLDSISALREQGTLGTLDEMIGWKNEGRP